jgi:hypothetical protein
VQSPLEGRTSDRNFLHLVEFYGDEHAEGTRQSADRTGKDDSSGQRHVKTPPGIEGTWCLRVDADNVEISESGAGSTEAAGRVRVGREEWGTRGRLGSARLF